MEHHLGHYLWLLGAEALRRNATTSGDVETSRATSSRRCAWTGQALLIGDSTGRCGKPCWDRRLAC
jgi:hypothetical protein